MAGNTSEISDASLARSLSQYGRGAHALATQILGDRDDAADAVQDALVKALQKPSAFDPSRGGLKTWFLSVVRHRCLDLIRRRRESGPGVDALATDTKNPEDAALRDENAQRVRTALGALATAQREILILRDFNDLDYAEIASVLDIPKGTVMSRLHRARLALRDALAMQGDF